MKKIIIILILLAIYPHIVMSAHNADQRRAEFFGNKVPPLKNNPTKEKDNIAKKFVSIFSFKRGSIAGWRWKDEKTGAISQMRSLDVRFKINQKGEFRLPILKVYLLDKYNNITKELTKARYGEGRVKIENLAAFSFKGKKTQILRFPLLSQTSFKNALIVMGNDTEITVRAFKKGTDITSLDFPEKELLS